MVNHDGDSGVGGRGGGRVGGRRRSGRVGRRAIAFVVAIVLVAAVALAYRPVYDYYRRAIADCVEWSNSYALNSERFRAVADAADQALRGAAQDGTSAWTSGEGDAAATLRRLRAEEDADNARVTAAFGADACGARQLPNRLHDEAERFRTHATRAGRRIAELHAKTDDAVARRLDHDPAAIAAARTRLAALADGVRAMADDTTWPTDGGTGAAATRRADAGLRTALDATRRLLDGASGDADASGGASIDGRTSGAPTLADYRASETTLLDAADGVVRARNAANGIDCADAGRRCVALTFDDGPSAAVTPKVLDVLDQAGAHATFFLVGGSVGDGTASIIRRGVKDRQSYGSHTWSHVDLPRILADGTQAHELDDASKTIAQATGSPVTLIRPPHGSVDERSREYVADRLGAGLALYDVDSYDWAEGATADSVKAKVLAQVRPGSIILMHDIQPHTAAALPDLLRGLRRCGYTPVTIPELVGEYPRPGTVYYSRDNILRM